MNSENNFNYSRNYIGDDEMLRVIDADMANNFKNIGSIAHMINFRHIVIVENSSQESHLGTDIAEILLGSYCPRSVIILSLVPDAWEIDNEKFSVTKMVSEMKSIGREYLMRQNGPMSKSEYQALDKDLSELHPIKMLRLENTEEELDKITFASAVYSNICKEIFGKVILPDSITEEERSDYLGWTPWEDFVKKWIR